MNIIEAIHDPQLFGPTLKQAGSWKPWLAFLRAVYGLPMDTADLARFRHHTGRQAPRLGGYPEAVCIVGCQSGKSQIAALVGVYEAMGAVLAGQRGVYVPLLAQDLRGAQRALFGYVKNAVANSPVLSHEVVRETQDGIELSGGVTLTVYPCRPAAIRGIRAACVIVDELAFFIATDGRPTDVEMLRAARTRTATTGGKVLILSSPYGQSGALWELHRRHFGQDDSSTLIWQASAPEMNPTLPADYLARMAQDDPEAYRSEVLGEFRTGITTLFDPDILQEAVDVGVRERPRHHSGTSQGFFDGASGSGKDAAVLEIAHPEGDKVILDCLRVWRPPFNPSSVIAEASDVLRSYGLDECTGDAYAPGFILEAFRANRVTYRFSELNRSQLYLELLPLVNAGRARLLDLPDLLRELRGLERRRGTSGRDKVDHRSGAHDDLANSCAGALVLAASALQQRAYQIPILETAGDDGAGLAERFW
jgi:hypothetical protein